MNHVLENVSFKLMKYRPFVNEDTEVIYINPGKATQISILQVGDKFVVGCAAWQKEFEWTNHVVDDICDCVEKGIQNGRCL